MTTGGKRIAKVILFISQRNIISATLRKHKVYKHKVNTLGKKNTATQVFPAFYKSVYKMSSNRYKD